MRDSKAALEWIVGVLEAHDCPYQVQGGLAARAYGSERELNDVDICVPREKVRELAEACKGFVSIPLREDHGVLIVELEYAGQKIELFQDAYKVFDRHQGKWLDYKADFGDFELKEVFGVLVPVIRKETLARHKDGVFREADKLDLQQMLK